MSEIDIDTAIAFKYGVKPIKRAKWYHYLDEPLLTPTSLLITELAILLLHVNRLDLLPLYIATAALFIFADLVDTYSTNTAITSVQAAEDRHQTIFSLRETNPRLPARPSIKDLTSPFQTLRMANALTACIICPTIGIIVGIGKLVISANNMRHASYYENY